MKNTSKRIFLIAMLLAAITSFVGYKVLTQTKKASSDTSEISLLVASENIPPRTKITQEMIKEIKVPGQSYILDSIQDKDKLIGNYAEEEILEGEAIPKERLIEENKKDLALRIPEGKRAIAISVDKISGVADLIKATDHVDIYATLEETIIENSGSKVLLPKITKLLFQNVEVLAISKEMNRKEVNRVDTPGSYSITLALSPVEVEKLIFSENIGEFKLALRPEGENKIENTLGIIREDITPEKGKKIVY